MLQDLHTFLFSPSEDIPPLTSRRVHLRRLYDVLHLSIQRGDLHHASRAWAILARCKEVDWRASWMLAIGLLDCSAQRTESNQTKIDYLRTVMLHFPEDREQILCELVHLYIVARRHREALHELEFYLPSFPYRDNAMLHIYAGICSVLASQPDFADEVDVQPIDSEMLGRAQIFFERAKSLDMENIVVDSLLSMVRMFPRDVVELITLNIYEYDGKIQNLTQNPMALLQADISDDETDPNLESFQSKRPRTS